MWDFTQDVPVKTVVLSVENGWAFFWKILESEGI